MSPTLTARATIVVVPRERFSVTRRSLESLYAYTALPFPLVYVDGGSPARVRRYLATQARDRGFRLVRTGHYLAPNEARNLALRYVTTPYVVFIDNDVVVSEGWLAALLDCAEETGAWIVGPVYCFRRPELRIVHMVGGVCRIEERNGQRTLVEKHRFPGRRLEEVASEARREPTELAEFHCMLVRTEVFGRLGLLDEGYLSDFEHVDFCLAVRTAGGAVYTEPGAVVTWVTPPPLAWTDLPYFLLRWSDAWSRASGRRFVQKWGLDERDPWVAHHYEFATEHRQLALWPLRRLLRGTLGWRRGTWVERRVVLPLEAVLNRRLVREVRRHAGCGGGAAGPGE